jgi:hypothetical protein
MTKIEADIRKRIKKFKPFDPEKLKALNDKIEKAKGCYYGDNCPYCKSGESHFELLAGRMPFKHGCGDID